MVSGFTRGLASAASHGDVYRPDPEGLLNLGSAKQEFLGIYRCLPAGPGAFLPFGMSPSHPDLISRFYRAAVGIPPGTSSFDAAPLPLFAMAFCAKVTWGSDVSGSIPRIGFSASFSRLRDSDVSSSCWLALSVSFASSGSPVEARFLPGVALRCFASHTAMGHSQQIHLSPVHGEGCVFLRGVPTKIGRPCSRISLFQGFPQPAFP
jgi:hypothetical protein